MVIWRSSMASSNAAWVRGGMRLTSSARRRSVNSGPRCSENVLVERLSTLLPMMSAGIRSEVHCTRRNSRSNIRAKHLMTNVLAMPGTPSSNAWPPHRIVSRHWLISSSWPTMTFASSVRPCVSTRDTVCMRNDLLSFKRNELQAAGMDIQLLDQSQRHTFPQLRIVHRGLDFQQQFLHGVVAVAETVADG